MMGDVLEQMFERQARRHSWLLTAGEQIRKWKAEEEAQTAKDKEVGNDRG